MIPLYEFMEMNLQVRYGINPDREILSILDTASKAKQVIFTIYYTRIEYFDYTIEILYIKIVKKWNLCELSR